MVQAKRCGNLAGAPIHENNKEGGKYHGQRIEFGHPGYQHRRKALAADNSGGYGMIDTSHQQQSYQTAYGTGK